MAEAFGAGGRSKPGGCFLQAPKNGICLIVSENLFPLNKFCLTGMLMVPGTACWRWSIVVRGQGAHVSQTSCLGL